MCIQVKHKEKKIERNNFSSLLNYTIKLCKTLKNCFFFIIYKKVEFTFFYVYVCVKMRK